MTMTKGERKGKMVAKGLKKIVVVINHFGATPELDQCADTVGTPRGCWHLRGAASVSIESRGRSSMLKDSVSPAGHDDSWR